VLSIIFVISCIGVFYLLRNHEPSEDDRAIRRQRSRRHQQNNDGSSFNYNASSSPSWKEKIFGRGKGDAGGGKTGKAKRRGGGGWIQAGSGDEWDSGDEEMGQIGPRGLGERPEKGQAVRFASSTSTIPRGGSSMTVDSPFQPPHRDVDSMTDSASSIRLDLHLPGPLSTDPYAPTPGASQSTTSLEPFQIPRSSSPESFSRAATDGKLPTPPGTPLRTFEGGTKFIESF
jgi:hypothetical protein